MPNCKMLSSLDLTGAMDMVLCAATVCFLSPFNSLLGSLGCMVLGSGVARCPRFLLLQFKMRVAISRAEVRACSKAHWITVASQVGESR